ncbi:ferredoxin reductase [Hydrogenophaga sp. OTU3427]|uniref:ferredoxin reductase n=1 Tax=Hydrogenophaga sp. OTU3427 TaxID=3043856 RepID=UPI00313E2C65
MTEPDWIEVRVARRWNEALDIVGLELVPLNVEALPAFEAGACIDVLTPGGHLRPYSLCNPASERHRYVIAVLREHHGRGGSASLHDDVKAGDRLRILAPRHEFRLATSAVHSLLLAGGIGVAPLLCMVDTLWNLGAAFELHYSARHAGRAAFVTTIERQPFAHCIHLNWSENKGRLQIPSLLTKAPLLTHVYACGPQAFICSVVAAFVNSGRPIESLHLEWFSTRREPRAMSI